MPHHKEDSLAAMAKKLPPTVGAKAIADILGISPATLLRWSERGQFPRPLPGLGSCPRWKRETVVAFFAKIERQAVEEVVCA